MGAGPAARRARACRSASGCRPSWCRGSPSAARSSSGCERWSAGVDSGQHPRITLDDPAGGASVEEPLELAEHVVQLARRAGADAADAVYDWGVEFSVTIRRDAIEKLQEATSRALGLRVFRDGRCAVSYTSDFTPAALARFVEQALDLVAVTDPDPLAGLPDPDAWAPPPPADLAIDDPALAAVSVEEKIALARRCEAAAFAYDPRITNSGGASFSSESGVRALVNSRGFAGLYRASGCSLVMEALADDADGKKRNAHWYSAARAFADLDSPEEIGRIAA